MIFGDKLKIYHKNGTYYFQFSYSMPFSVKNQYYYVKLGNGHEIIRTGKVSDIEKKKKQRKCS